MGIQQYHAVEVPSSSMEYSLAIFVLCVSLCLHSIEPMEHQPVLPSSGKKPQGWIYNNESV